MNKKRKILMLGINLLFTVALLCALLIPVERKTAAYTNTDIKRYKSLNTIPKIGAITNNRDAELRFSLYDEKLYGIYLFFYVEGEDMSGDIVCTLEQNGAIVAEQMVEVKELFALMDKNEVKPKEILFPQTEKSSGEYILTLKGKGISPKTRISFYGNKADSYFVEYQNANLQNYNGILYIVETLEKERPYIWGCAFLLSMSLVFSLIVYSNGKEKKHESYQKI